MSTLKEAIEAKLESADKAEVLPILLECVEALDKCANKTIWNNNSLEQDFFETNEIALKALERLRKWSECEKT